MTDNPATGEDQGSFGFGMTELEERLSGADGHTLRDEIAELLAEKAKQLRERMETGLTPDEYHKATAVQKALAAAYDIVTHFPAGSRAGQG